MQQLDRLWNYQKADMDVVRYETEMRQFPMRQKLLKLRNLVADQQTLVKGMENDAAAALESAGLKVGNVTHAMPAAQFYIGVGEGLGTHTAPFAEASGGPAGKRALLAAVKVLAMTGLDMMAE